MRLGVFAIVFMSIIVSVVYSQRLQYHRPMRPGYSMMSGIRQVHGKSRYPRKFLIIGTPKGPMKIRMQKPAAVSYSNIKRPKTVEKSPVKTHVEIWPKTTEKPKKYQPFKTTKKPFRYTSVDFDDDFDF